VKDARSRKKLPDLRCLRGEIALQENWDVDESGN
jgi:hypothetical protein